MDSPVSASAVTRREPCPGPAEASWSAAALSGARTAAASPLRALFAPVDIASLVWFRVAFGLLVLVEVWRHTGTIAATYIRPAFHFTYYGFDWIRPWPGDGMYLHFVVLGLAAACVAVGLCYRLAATVCCLGLGYWFLLEQARYHSYSYLLALLGLLMIFVPAHRAFSIDAWRDRELRARTAPAWALWLLRAQIALPFVFAGLARLSSDWLRGEPVRMWLAERADWPVFGPLFTREWVVYLFSHGWLLFDLLIVPALLWRRTRPHAFAAAVLCTLIHSAVFDAGIFPWVLAAATLMFFAPDWPRRLGRRLAELVGLRLPDPELPPRPLRPPPLTLWPRQRLTVGCLLAYLSLQVLVPLRHWLYPGDVVWTEEGQHFSWRTNLRDKRATVRFLATDPAEEYTWEIDPRQYLLRWQRLEMSGRPEMILQFAHFLADDLRAQGHEEIEIRAVASVSLNGRRPQLLIDPEVDLASQPRSLWPDPWILPMAYPELHAARSG